MKKWLVIGVSGVTCGGKTTVAETLNKMIPGSHLLSQDDYFLPVDSKEHTWIPALNHINWEIMSSVDMEKMMNDINKITQINFVRHIDDCKASDSAKNNSETLTAVQNKAPIEALPFNVLIIEGFLILNYQPIDEICHIKYYLTLTREQCWERRKVRVYDPPDVPGYFDICVWPEYKKHRDEILQKVTNVHIVDGTADVNLTVSNILLGVMMYRNL